jgi:5-methylcytosine-specific restriction endonuclease McrA
MKERRMYDSVRWRKARARHLAEYPLCSMCERQARETAASVVDHIKEHKGDHDLFWDPNNWQSLCPSCHSGIKRMQEHHGYSQAADIDGQPMDAGHPWNKA